MKLIEIKSIEEIEFNGFVYDLEVQDDHSYNIDGIIVHNSDAVLMGGYFAQADCAETWIRGDGTYWGGASTKQQQLNGSVTRHSEGKVIPLENKRPLKDLVNDLVGGIASAVSYSGYKSLLEFIGNGVFERKHR